MAPIFWLCNAARGWNLPSASDDPVLIRVTKWHWSKFSQRIIWLFPANHEICGSPKLEAHYHTLGTKLGTSSGTLSRNKGTSGHLL